MKLIAAIALSLLLLPSLARAGVQFFDVSATAGITSHTSAFGIGAGAAAADYDDDGDIDFFLPTEGGTTNRLYENLGNGQFHNAAAAAGLASTDQARAALWFDYDGDGLLDLLVASDCFSPVGCAAPIPILKLYRQVSPGSFQDVTVAAGLPGPTTIPGESHVGGLVAGDLNNDGYLDLFCSYWNFNWLFLNNRDGTFTDVTAAAGVDVVTDKGWQPVIHDFDKDGWGDIFQAIDFAENRLWMNQRNGLLVDMAALAGVDDANNEMGVTLGDLDNDGDFEIFVTNIYENGLHNVLYRDDTAGVSPQFAEVSYAAGVEDAGWGWGTSFFDADRDGWLDLAATNGYFLRTDTSRFFRHDGNVPVTFSDMSSTVGFDDDDWGSGLVTFDYDRDGDLDMLQSVVDLGMARLLENELTGGEASNHWLTVKPRRMGPNRRGIGAVVRVTVGSVVMSRVITAGTSFLGQEPAEAFFGLGNATSVDRVTVEWPDGSETSVASVAADQVVTVTPEIEIHLAAPTLTASGRVTWPVTYLGADTITLAPGDVSLQATGTATANGPTTIEGSGSQRSVTVSGAAGVGTLALMLAAGTASASNGATASAAGPGPGASIGDTTDGDADKFADVIDNCPGAFNPTQKDSDADGLGDICDPMLELGPIPAMPVWALLVSGFALPATGARALRGPRVKHPDR